MNQSTLKDSSERGDKRHEWANLKTEIEASIDAICRGNFDEMCRQFLSLGILLTSWKTQHLKNK